jgi:hypothetical protein
MEYQGVSRVYFVSETAQVELNSERVKAPGERERRWTCATSSTRSGWANTTTP